MKSSKLLFVGALMASVFTATSAFAASGGCTRTGGTPANDQENACSGEFGDPAIIGGDSPDGSPGGDGSETGSDTSSDTPDSSPDGATTSDIRLKQDIVELSRLENGLGLYRFRYLNDDQVYVGVMAQEVEKIAPDAVVRGDDGYLRVKYGRLGLRMVTWEDWSAQQAETLH